MTSILGISAFYHDSAAAQVATQEATEAAAEVAQVAAKEAVQEAKEVAKDAYADAKEAAQENVASLKAEYDKTWTEYAETSIMDDNYNQPGGHFDKQDKMLEAAQEI